MMRLIAWTLMWLAVCPLAFAAPTVITRYVDTDTGDNGNDGTTPATAWATMYYARAQYKTYGQNSDGDFTATGETYPEGIIGHLYCAGSVADTTYATWDVVTNSTHYMEITGDGDYTLSIAGAVGMNGCAVSTDAIIFENIHFARSSTTGDGQRCVSVMNPIGPGGYQRFIGCTFTGVASETYPAWLIYTNDTDAQIELNNCKLVDAGSVVGSRAVYAYAGTIYVYNCTIDNCYHGIVVNDVAIAKVYAKNTIVTGSAGDAYNKGASGILELSYCTSDDATATTYDTGSTCTDNVSPTFTGDYQLASTDTTWIDGGTDLIADDHWHDDAVDAWDTARPQGSAWDIGWHEYVAVGDTDELVLLRRRRAGG